MVNSYHSATHFVLPAPQLWCLLTYQWLSNLEHKLLQTLQFGLNCDRQGTGEQKGQRGEGVSIHENRQDANPMGSTALLPTYQKTNHCTAAILQAAGHSRPQPGAKMLLLWEKCDLWERCWTSNWPLLAWHKPNRKKYINWHFLILLPVLGQINSLLC